jgi:hypothetical protein
MARLDARTSFVSALDVKRVHQRDALCIVVLSRQDDCQSGLCVHTNITALSSGR